MTRGFLGRTRALFLVGVATVVASAGLGVVGTATPAGAAETDAGQELVAASNLVAYLPADQRGACIRVDPSTFADGNFAGAEALVTCLEVSSDIDSLIYVKYPTAEDLQQAYSAQLPADIPTGESGTPCPVETTWSYDGEGGGNDACFVETNTNSDGEAVEVGKMIWTADEQLILGFAVNTNGDADALKEWWSNESGPLQDPDTAGLAPLTDAGWAKEGKQLIGTLPAAATKCETLEPNLDESSIDTNDPDYGYAPYLATSVDCKAPKGSVRYWKVAPEVASGYASILQSYVYDSEYPGLKTPKACDEASTVKVGKKVVGAIGCWYYQDTLWVAWYNEQTGVVGGYTTSRSPADALKYAKANLV